VLNSAAPGSITVYRRTDNGDVTPLRTIIGPAAGFSVPQGVVLDLMHDEVFVGDPNAKILVFERTAHGNAPPLRILTGQHTGLTSPLTAVLDLIRDEMWVLDGGSSSMKLYPRTAVGDVPPLRVIQGAGTRIHQPLDAVLATINDELIVANSNANTITIYPRTEIGEIPPLREIIGGHTGLNNPQGVFAVATAPLVGAILPISRSVQQNTAATAFATMINAGAGPGQACLPMPITAVPVFSFQRANAQNVPVGTPNIPVNLAAGRGQSFVSYSSRPTRFLPRSSRSHSRARP